jgi:hypothetical protein
MIFYKIFGALLMIGFVALLHGIGMVATELPRGEGWDEEEFDDPPQYRVESEEWLPVRLERR